MHVEETFVIARPPQIVFVEPSDEGTRVHFTAEGELTGLMRLVEPLARRGVARRFARYHGNLRRSLERS